MKRINTNDSIFQQMKFKLIIPVDPIKCSENLEQCPTRNWGVPGEILYFYILTSSTILQLDSLSFSIFVNKKQAPSSRSTLSYSEAFPSTHKSLDICETRTLHEFNIKNAPFRIPDGRAVYPLSVRIPITMTTPFNIDIFLPRTQVPVLRAEMVPLIPFDISVLQRSTSISTIIHYNILATLRSTSVKKVQIDDADVEFDTKPPHNNEDIISNIQIVKPCQKFVKCKVQSDDQFSVLFSFIPLSEIGALMLSNLALRFLITWRYENLSYTTVWESKFESASLGITLLVHPVTAQLMNSTSIPMKISNFKDEKRNIEIFFDNGPLQPVMEKFKVSEIEPNSSITVNIGVLPLSVGYHQLKFWAEENGERIEPLFPTYISVTE